ncbi:MAG: PAS domain S-box protein [Desulfotomaculaceae bacterium]|nr:PAS domain S-box protein [Desulfotomaculaceae bacterium]
MKDNDKTREQLIEELEALRRREKYLRSLVENSSDVIMMIDDNQNIAYSSTSAVRVIDYKPEKYIGIKAFALFCPEDIPGAVNNFTGFVKEMSATQHVELRIQHCDRSWRFFRVFCRNLPDESGSPIILIDARDITGYKQADDRDITKLKQSEDKYPAYQQLLDIIDFLPDATYVIDHDKKVIAWNRAIEEMTGVRKEDILGKGEYAYTVPFYGRPGSNLIDLIFSDDSEAKLKYEYVERKGNKLFAEIFIPYVFEGKGAFLWSTTSPLFNTDGNLVGAIQSIRDITGYKQMAEALREHSDNLEELVKKRTVELKAANEHLLKEIAERKQAEEKLLIGEERYRNIVEDQTELIIRFLPDGTITLVNDACCRYYRMEKEVLIGHNIELFIPGYNKYEHSLTHLNRENPVIFFEHSVVLSDGEVRWQQRNVRAIFNETGRLVEYQSVASDITDRKRMEVKLQYARQQLLDIIEFLPDATLIINRDKKVTAWNRATEELTGVRKEDIIGKGDYAVHFYGKSRPMLIDLVFSDYNDDEKNYKYIRRKGNLLLAENYTPSVLGGKGAVLWGIAAPLLDGDGNLVGAIESIRDITELKQVEEKLRYFSLHDSLTGLYNRSCFEQEMCRLEEGSHAPVSIIVCDIDGLKLVNDTLGHNNGDALLVSAASVIKGSFRACDMVARIGGDEFAVILPKSDRLAVESAAQRIKHNIARYNSAKPLFPLSLSIGFAVSEEESISFDDLFKEADNNMYREKLHHRQSARNAIVQTLKKALEARDYITDGHADRLQDLVAALAITVGLPKEKLADLRLLAQFHDIGKVGVPDRILFKPGPLTQEEVIEMQRHCEIGYRIAKSAPDLVPIADWLHLHHEWWNGGGYPLGLKGDEIPLESRILAIADAYDAMTNDRPYRKAMTHDEAVAELKRRSGSQFNPQLVQEFVQILKKVTGESKKSF